MTIPVTSFASDAIDAPSAPAADPKQVYALRVAVAHINFGPSPKTAWTITRCANLGSPASLPSALGRVSNDTFAVVGTWPGCARGLTWDVKARVKVDPKYGPQLELSEPPRLVTPSDREGMISMLSAENVTHLGPVRAAAAIERFGVDGVIRILEDEPERLAEIKGITPERAAAAAEGWRALRASQVPPETRRALYARGLTPYQVARLCTAYGAAVLDVLDRDPYATISLDGIGFLTADGFRRGSGISDDDPRRVRAAVAHILEQLSEEGHTCAPAETVSALVRLDRHGRAKGLGIGVDEAAVEREFARLVKAHTIVDVGAGRYALASLHEAETDVASALRDLVSATPPPLANVDVSAILAPYGLTDEQQQAPAALHDVGVVVVTGGPGTGKTHTLRAACDLLSASGSRVMLAAPTGKAARRMEEATGRQAHTVHRLLAYNPETGFQVNEESPLEPGTVVVDESSMLDSELAAALLTALVPGRHRLALVGDADQLPSVGPGAVLRDVIDSGAVPVVRLTKILRQQDGSNVVSAAHAVIRGDSPRIEPWPAPGRDFKVRVFDDETSAADVAEALVAFIFATLPPHAATMGLDVLRDVQVLAPMRRADVGCDKLNVRLRELLNPVRPGEASFVVGGREADEARRRDFRVGDRVIQTRNDYKRGVFNGETGVVVDAAAAGVVVDFGDRSRAVAVEYNEAGAKALRHSYALTVHKSQGSEWPIVVIPVHSSHAHMWSRQLLYTGITRASKLCVLFATDKALALAVRRDQADKRNTTLKELLK